MHAALDHLVVNVRDKMDEAAMRYRKLGFHLPAEGHHSLGSTNHVMVFETEYLELMGLPPEVAARGGGPDITRDPVGLAACALTTVDAGATHRDLQALGISAKEPASFSRPVELGRVTREAAFTITRIDPVETPAGRVFFCQHHTRDLVWRPEWQTHPNGALGIVEVDAVVPEPAQSAVFYETLLGRDAVKRTAGSVHVTLGSATLRLMTKADMLAFYGVGSAPNDDRSAYLAAVTLKVAAVDRTAAYLNTRAIIYAVAEGAVVVPAHECMNMIVRFRNDPETRSLHP
jgi:catechol 2,3-dioxygenase-like lactoylglutathione lyase family enzyme